MKKLEEEKRLFIQNIFADKPNSGRVMCALIELLNRNKTEEMVEMELKNKIEEMKRLYKGLTEFEIKYKENFRIFVKEFANKNSININQIEKHDCYPEELYLANKTVLGLGITHLERNIKEEAKRIMKMTRGYNVNYCIEEISMLSELDKESARLAINDLETDNYIKNGKIINEKIREFIRKI